MQAQHAKDEEAFKEKQKEIAIFETQTKAQEKEIAKEKAGLEK